LYEGRLFNIFAAQLVDNIAEDTHVLKTEPKKVIAGIKYHNQDEATLWR